MTTKVNALPPLNGLILSGGKSSRMGRDKGLLTYHKTSQIAHLTTLLNSYCEQVFISAKRKTDYPDFPVIADQYSIESPLNGILSALILHQKNAWLIIACDMPFIDAESIEYLIKNRLSGKLATCYQNKLDQTEPLFCIWEPQSLPLLSNFQLKDELSPKKFLNANNSTLIHPLDFKVLTNVNTLERYKKMNNDN